MSERYRVSAGESCRAESDITERAHRPAARRDWGRAGSREREPGSGNQAVKDRGQGPGGGDQGLKPRGGDHSQGPGDGDQGWSSKVEDHETRDLAGGGDQGSGPGAKDKGVHSRG